MRQAEQWLTEQGFEFENVSAFDSCDFRAQRRGEKWVIEVKGTTGGPESVLLTANEVALHRSSHPRNALLIVHGIALSKDGTKILAGGHLSEVVPWAINGEILTREEVHALLQRRSQARERASPATPAHRATPGSCSPGSQPAPGSIWTEGLAKG